MDRGGTFTDCIARAPDGALHTRKLLSSEEAPLQGIRELLREAAGWRPGEALPPCTVKLGTTLATNALLERRGAACAFATNRGLGDLVRIGTQQRPELFALAIEKPAPLHALSLELPGRMNAAGVALEPFDEAAAREALRRAREAGLQSLAVAGAHAYLNPVWEERVAALAREAGFTYIATSANTAREIGLLARAETTLADAYLTPLLRAHVRRLEAALPGARLRFMQSSGGLTDAAHFRGPAALLSGPAGGAIGAARVAAEAGCARAIGFDMGGTSTDVSLVVDGETDRSFETALAGVRVRAPMLHIHSVASGGGSLCRFDGFRLTVGPESAGADPGPLCYGRDSARELALTDVNFFLGRLRAERFPIPLQRAPVSRAIEALAAALRAAKLPRSPDEIAAGFIEIANANMAQAIREISVGRGVDPRGFALVGFGGAAGQHVCAVARRLGIRSVLLHPLAGLLSAYGIGVAELAWERQRDVGRVALESGGRAPQSCLAALAELEAEARAALAAEGGAPPRVERFLDLRYRGAETALAVAAPAGGDWLSAFAEAHRARFGYVRPQRAVEVVNARIRARAAEADFAAAALRAPPQAESAARRAEAPRPLGRDSVWFPGAGRLSAPIYAREALADGDIVSGPALLLEGAGTVLLDPGFCAEQRAGGLLVLTDEAATGQAATRREDSPAPQTPQADSRAAQSGEALREADPVRLEVFGNRFMSIAEQMGAVLRNTAVSTNIKERLDYSCAVFDSGGGLVANAPHIPVHLGAMGATVRAVRRAIPDLRAGDAIVTNDPAEGGSHLPDVTLVSPVFVAGALHFFVASRGHQADIGGISPGSMPAHSRTLEEEGVVLRAFPLLRDGVFHEARVREALQSARWPARNPEDNLADLEAMVAANRCGEALLREMVAEQGLAAVRITMGQLQQAAGAKVSREIAKLGDGERAFEDRLDDGAALRVQLRVQGGRLRLDFSGSAAAQIAAPDSPAAESQAALRASNLNAPRAVVESAVIYVLRCLVAERIPLNGGCLLPVEICVPPGSLLDPPPGAAVVGGNVETSQRIVDVLLGAMGRAAASQGTMNNLAFGNARFGYYETIGGGAGAGPGFGGASGVHTHMTNTRITDPEILEARAPVIVRRFALRRGSGGAGRFCGGDGLLRELEFTEAVEASLLSERRAVAPWGLAGGGPGAVGRNTLLRADGSATALAARARIALAPGDRLRIETPGGGGYGPPTGG
ncbi:MAG: hydantoinase B/oxoprolinase family protein [Deltaproteobacteria bacterium]|nr:hydantoinase B/oxoprolinase family protein [Deltaproteobacteria bacterium]